MCEPVKVTRYYVRFAGSNGRARFVGATDPDGRSHYPTQRDAAELFATFAEAEAAADDIPQRYIVKRTLPQVKAVTVLVPGECMPRHQSLALTMQHSH